MFDYLVFIGRFQPFHLGHSAIVSAALANSKKLIMLIGSANKPRSPRNPFTFDERVEMIKSSVAEKNRDRVICLPLEDIVYNDTLWVKKVQEAVASVAPAGSRVGLIGHKKDNSSYYLSLFPTWQSIAMDNVQGIDGTEIRKGYLLDKQGYSLSIPSAVQKFLYQFKSTNAYEVLCSEAGFIQQYKQEWANSPYPPTFVTVDAVVVQAGHVLLIQRKSAPGRGLWALPGGFIGQRETLLDACVRELYEETRIKVPELVLRGSLKSSKTYDDPNRSERGRTITTAFRFDIKPDPRSNDVKLPKVRGSDDAEAAFWVPLAEVNPSMMYEDHYSILIDMIG